MSVVNKDSFHLLHLFIIEIKASKWKKKKKRTINPNRLFALLVNKTEVQFTYFALCGLLFFFFLKILLGLII